METVTWTQESQKYQTYPQERVFLGVPKDLIIYHNIQRQKDKDIMDLQIKKHVQIEQNRFQKETQSREVK